MLSLRIAMRYLLSRKSHGAVNVISIISLAAIAVAAAAMIIVLSVFNGFTQLAESKLSSIDPDFMLVPLQGKTIEKVDSVCAALSEIEGVSTVQPEITEQAFALANGRQMPVTIKGMTAEALAASGIGKICVDGTPDLLSDSAAMLSAGVAMKLNLRPVDGINRFTIHEPRRVGRINPANPMAAFRTAHLTATGVFMAEMEEYDRDMVIVPLGIASNLLNYSDQASSIAVYIDRNASKSDVSETLDNIARQIGAESKDRHRQQEASFRMIEIEKWITFLMLAFILAVASCNIISTLSMLILEKEENMGIMSAMGGTHNFINRIFTTQGWLIIILGGTFGITAGSLLVLGQQHFGWIKIASSNPAMLSIETYPVLLSGADIIAALAAIAAVALLITPVIPLIRRK